jgi:hypothetical protein
VLFGDFRGISLTDAEPSVEKPEAQTYGSPTLRGVGVEPNTLLDGVRPLEST